MPLSTPTIITTPSSTSMATTIPLSISPVTSTTTTELLSIKTMSTTTSITTTVAPSVNSVPLGKLNI